MDFVQFDALTGLYLSSPLLSNFSSDTCTNPCQNPQVLSAVSISSHPWVHKPFLAMVYQCQQPDSPLPFDTQTHTCQNPSVSTASCISTHSLVHIPILTIVHQCQQLTPSVPILWCTHPSLLHSTSVNNQTHPPPPPTHLC